MIHSTRTVRTVGLMSVEGDNSAWYPNVLRAISEGSSVVLYCRGLLRKCVHCGAGCPSDCRGNACGCGGQCGDDTTSFSRLQSLSVEENAAECA